MPVNSKNIQLNNMKYDLAEDERRLIQLSNEIVSSKEVNDNLKESLTLLQIFIQRYLEYSKELVSFLERKKYSDLSIKY